MIQAQALYRSMDKFALVVVLFFILCGNVMTSGSIVDKLIKVANVTVGWLPRRPGHGRGHRLRGCSGPSPAPPWPRWWPSAGS